LEIKKGTFKREIDKLNIKDRVVGDIIIKSLIESGYDIISLPKFCNEGYQIGETLTIYRIEDRFEQKY
jgi:hypothetical protein